jgi:beta-glucuronidase
MAGPWRKLRFQADHNLTLGKRDAAGYASIVAEAAGRYLASFADTAWASVTLPAVENTMNAYQKTPEYYENGIWYRRSFSAPDSLRNRAAILKFLSVNYVADVWLNGSYLGWHEGGYTPFAFDVSQLIRFDTANVLAVRVDNPPWNSGQTTGTNRRIDMVPYYTVDWFNYAGIIHDVLLEFPDSISIPRVDVVPLDVQGNVKVGVTVRNRGTQVAAVDVALHLFEAVVDSTTIDSPYPADLAGASAAVSGTTQGPLAVAKDSCRAWKTTLTVAAPRLWSPKHPNLYIMKVTVSQGGRVLDEFATQFGLRTVTTSGSKLLLNGQTVFLPGIARHEDHPVYGRSIPRNVIASDLKKIKTLNVALLRTAHYPNHPYTYMMADRLGLAILEEIPVWWFDTDQAWLIQNGLRHIHTQMFREMVFRDYNRPSVLFWSTCNECMAVTGRQQFIADVNAELDGQYPDGRLVTESAAADRPGPSDPTQASCDIASWTMYFGIFHGGTYYDGTRQFLLNAHASQPGKPVMDTEFGYWSGENGSTEQTQLVVLDSTFMAFRGAAAVDSSGAVNPSGFLAATTWWTAFDWYTCQQPAGYESMGVFHMDRATPKPVAAALARTYLPYYNTMMTTGIGDRGSAGVPGAFGLSQNYPNPFNPATQIRYSLPNPGVVTLRVYDLLGRAVATLVNARQQAGDHIVAFSPGRDGGSLSSGVYFYRLESGQFVAVQKMMYLK